ncbi:MAG: N-acetylmuramoyl-L-alanine amidase [Candidatus Eremiobacteraeota bacterium]|nr:N-acetylmuramoyl-L-alanine amidase [Candidatus Eremiobacteraeota bacterium]MCW5868532.1 N-acetylmuramoyl-L-alanine amidase [Candidatus Eremiobacteraeota bacterium]
MRRLLVLAALSGWGWAQPQYDMTRTRPLESWKRQITEYSRRHYGEADWRLKPRCIVLHYTAGTSFPWNLVNTPDFAGETPGLASHYVVDGAKIWQIIPPEVRSRGAYGINHRAINIEMVGADARDMIHNRKCTLDTTAELVRDLLERFQLTAKDVYSHQQVAEMNTRVCPWVLDLVNGEPYHKVDPGAASMRYVLDKLAR